MRISWLEPETIRVARAALTAYRTEWAAHFRPHFEPPPAPDDIPASEWPRVAEHVARAEQVSEVIRERGLPAAMMAFRKSGHAIEVATLVAASLQVDQVTFELVADLLACDIDDLVVYGPFLDLLRQLGGGRRERAVQVYERFCEAFEEVHSDRPMWRDRVDAVRDGLAGIYAWCGHHEQAHEVFARRHEEERRTLVVALAASRTFLSEGEVGRAVVWLGLGAERADALGRADMAQRLRDKQDTLRARQS